MKYIVWWDINDQILSDAEEAAAFLDQQSVIVNNWGTRGFALWFGVVTDGWMGGPLRVDLDPDVGRAALRWIPDGTHAVELAPEGPIMVLEDSGKPLVEISGELARVSLGKAWEAVREYVTTGEKPACTRWENS